MGLKITSEEHIKKYGDFELDGLWVKSLKFENVTQNGGKKIITVELVPYADLEDGTHLFDLDIVKKVYIADAQEYLESGVNPAFNTAYFAVEQGLVAMMQEQHGWACVFEMPEV